MSLICKHKFWVLFRTKNFYFCNLLWESALLLRLDNVHSLRSIFFQGPSYEKAQSMQSENVFPQRQMYEEPLLLHEGKMQWLFDHRGKRYLDMFGGIATVSVGHCHPSVYKNSRQKIIIFFFYVNTGPGEIDFQTSKRSDRQTIRYFGSRVRGVWAPENVRIRGKVGVENAGWFKSKSNNVR